MRGHAQVQGVGTVICPVRRASPGGDLGTPNPEPVLHRVLRQEHLGRFRPKIGKILRHGREAAAVKVGCLVDQVRLMAQMEGRVAEPRRHRHLDGVCHLRREFQDAIPGRVGVTAAGPFIHGGQSIQCQRRHVAHPHPDRRMPPPAVVGNDERAQTLQRFHALFAQTGRIERRGARCEIRIGQKGLHAPSVPRRAGLIALAAEVPA